MLGQDQKIQQHVREQRPCKADSSACSQSIPSLLWKSKFYYRFHKTLPLVRSLSQMNPFDNSLSPEIGQDSTLELAEED
jgi:hypothetical protein